MKRINNVMKCSLIAFTMLVISACNSGGTGSQTGINLTGNWAGTMTVDGTTFQVTVTLAQNTSATLGVTSSSVDGNLRIVGVCLVPFTGGVLNLNTNTFTVGAGTDFSLISSVTNDSISGSINSIDPTPDDNEGCGSFQGPFSLTRAA